MPQELMIHKLVCRSAALNIDAQTHAQESFELLAQFLGFLEAGRAMRGDKVERLERLFVEVWWFGFDHFDGHDAERPDVDF